MLNSIAAILISSFFVSWILSVICLLIPTIGHIGLGQISLHDVSMHVLSFSGVTIATMAFSAELWCLLTRIGWPSASARVVRHNSDFECMIALALPNGGSLVETTVSDPEGCVRGDNRYRVGAEWSIRYNPTSPQQVQPQLGLLWSILLGILALPFFAIFLGYVSLICSWVASI